MRAGCAWERTVAREVTPAPRPRPAGMEPFEELKARFENVDVNFRFDSYALDDRAREILEAKAEFLHEFPEIKVVIEGHCDERGTVQYNLALGDRRAYAAREYVKGLGIGQARMSTLSYGEERPLDPRSNEEAWSKNRRAHFVIQGP